MESMEETYLPDGRRAQLWTGGATAGPTVLVCHGTPDTRWVARTGADAASAAGVRLVAVNRPGYGTSTPDMVSTGVGATTREFTDVVLSELPGSLTNAEFYREAVA